MNKIKNDFIEYKNIYLKIALFILVLTGIFIVDRSAPDTYTLEAYAFMGFDSLPYFNDGRFIMTIFVMGLKFLKCPYHVFKIISWLLAFTSLFLSVVIIEKLIKKETGKDRILLSLLLIVNPFIVEYFIFADYTGVMCLGILFATCSCYNFIRYLSEKNIKYFFYASIFSLLTAFSYQGVISLIVLLPICFTLKYSKSFKNFIINNIKLALLYAVPTLFSLIIGFIIKTGRLTSDFSIIDKVMKIFSGFKYLVLSTFGILPKYFLVMIFIFLLIILVYSLITNRKKYFYYLFFGYCLLAIIIVPLAPQLVVSYDNVWVVPRSTIGLGILCPIVILFYYLYCSENEKISIILPLVMSLIFIFQFLGYIKFAYNQIKNNALENNELNRVLSYIYEYEDDINKVDNLIIYPDQNIRYAYDNVFVAGDMNVRTFARDWGIRAILSAKLQREFNIVEDMEFKKYCMDNDWNEFNSSIIKVENNSLYMCIY